MANNDPKSPIVVVAGKRKVSISTLSGAVSVFGCWAFDSFLLDNVHQIPGYVGAAIATIVMGVLFFVVPEAYQTQ